MGGISAQGSALANGGALRSLPLACPYAAPGPFCSRMFRLWEELAPEKGVPFVMRDVTLWAFTLPFFQEREDELREFEAEMAAMDQPVEAYLAQLHSIQHHDTTDRLGSLSVPTLVLAGEEDILIPVELSRALQGLIPGAEWTTVRGGHACLWEHPDSFNEAVVKFLSSVGAAA